ncbi:hypothetical protein PCE1_002018 [Barthelona sp. PCE]
MGTWISSIFGGEEDTTPVVEVTDKDKAMLDLKRQRDRLKRYSRKLEKVLDTEMDLAREALKANDRRKATMCLKRKKMQERALSEAENHLMNVETLITNTESAIMTQEVAVAMESGTTLLNMLNEEISIERIEDIFDAAQDAVDEQRDIQEAFAALSLTDDALVDMDEEIENEMNAWELEFAEEEALQNQTLNNTPSDVVVEEVDAVEEVEKETRNAVAA